jgi:alpha-L-arabinofuranosidase
MTDLDSCADHSQGPASSTYGSQRSALGYPDPFEINYIEIGNEDFFDGSGSYQSEIYVRYDYIKTLTLKRLPL